MSTSSMGRTAFAFCLSWPVYRIAAVPQNLQAVGNIFHPRNHFSRPLLLCRTNDLDDSGTLAEFLLPVRIVRCVGISTPS